MTEEKMIRNELIMFAFRVIFIISGKRCFSSILVISVYCVSFRYKINQTNRVNVSILLV